MTNPSLSPDPSAASNNTQNWSHEELMTLALAVGVLVFWAACGVLFGFVGIIFPALALVLTVFVLLVTISVGG